MARIVGIFIAIVLTWQRVKAKTLRGLSRNESLKCRIATVESLERQDDGKVRSKHETVCIQLVDETETSAILTIALPKDIREVHKSEIEAGTLIVLVEGGIVNGDEISLSADSSFVVLDASQLTRRQLQEEADHRTVAIVRVSTSSGSQVGYSADVIRRHLFENENCMAKQFYNCFNGNVHMEYTKTYEITVPGKSSDYSSPAQIRNEALAVLARTGASPEKLADHVMVILPPNGFSFVANAVINHWLSTYNDLWSLDMTVYMHEIGTFTPLGSMY